MATRSPKHGLTQHVRGGWYKSVNGHWKQVVGKVEAPTAADADRVYEERFAELWAGVDQAPRAPLTQAQIADLFDHYLNAKRLERDAPNGIRPRTYDEYRGVLQDFSDVVGGAVRYTDLSPMIFTHVHQAWRRKYGPHRLGKYVTIVRGAFNWLKANGFIADVPQYGDFVQPSRADFRRHRARLEDQGIGGVAFTPKELAALLDKGDVTQRAQILLALNGGFGNTDLSELRERVIDFDHGWIDYRRGKTGVKRRCPLWPETIEAVQAAKPLCRIVGNVFSTSDGRPLVQGTHDRLAARFKTLCETANCYLEGRGFYALRHLFSTEAVKHGSTLLVKRITGHTSGEEDRVLDEHYVGGVDAKLCEIVNAVRHAVLSEWPGARLEAALPAAPLPAASHRPGKPRSGSEGKRSGGRTARRRSSPAS
jgi:integrase